MIGQYKDQSIEMYASKVQGIKKRSGVLAFVDWLGKVTIQEIKNEHNTGDRRIMKNLSENQQSCQVKL